MVFTTGRIMLSLVCSRSCFFVCCCCFFVVVVVVVVVLFSFFFFFFFLFCFFFFLFCFFFFCGGFSVLFSIVITSLGEERADLCGSHASICLLLHALIPVLFLVLLVSGVSCGL